MVKCCDGYHIDKRTARTDVRGFAWGRCVILKKRFKLDRDRDCEDFTDVSIDDLFVKEGEVK